MLLMMMMMTMVLMRMVASQPATFFGELPRFLLGGGLFWYSLGPFWRRSAVYVQQHWLVGLPAGVGWWVGLGGRKEPPNNINNNSYNNKNTNINNLNANDNMNNYSNIIQC